MTAGNAPGVNDGAAALVVMGADVAARLNLTPIARVVGYATAGLEPKLVMMTPVEAVRKLNKKTGWKIDDADLLELNEAFAVQAVAVTRELGLDPARVNVQGGAVALGHPDRRQRRAHSDDAALRAEAPGQEARHRDAVPRRRQWRGDGSGTL